MARIFINFVTLLPFLVSTMLITTNRRNNITLPYSSRCTTGALQSIKPENFFKKILCAHSIFGKYSLSS